MSRRSCSMGRRHLWQERKLSWEQEATGNRVYTSHMTDRHRSVQNQNVSFILKQMSGFQVLFKHHRFIWIYITLPLSNSNQTTTNPLCVLHRWYWMPQLHTWQPLSMCVPSEFLGVSGTYWVAAITSKLLYFHCEEMSRQPYDYENRNADVIR